MAVTGESVYSSTDHLIACSDCDLLLKRTNLKTGHSLACPRCGNSLGKAKENSVSKTLALSVTALFLYIPAMFLPLLNLEALGLHDSGNVIESIAVFGQSGYYFVGFVFAFSAMLFPLLLIGSVFLLSVSLFCGCYPKWLKKVFRFYIHIEEWAMLEVYLLGIIIAIIKMKGMAQVSYEAGFFCFLLLVLMAVAMNSVLDRDLFWKLIEYKGLIPDSEEVYTKTSEPVTAASVGLIQCHDCHKLVPEEDGHELCPRCDSTLHMRKSSSLSRTWALVLSSLLLLVPANVLPIMKVDFLGTPAASTIMDGIIYFFDEGSYFIGGVILTASVLVPVFKVVGMGILLLTIRFNLADGLRQKAVMFRMIAFIGRWSMLDIFVIGLLAALVDFGFFTSIDADTAASYFCAVVVVTMCAVIFYDPRIMWDRCQPLSPGSSQTDKLEVSRSQK